MTIEALRDEARAKQAEEKRRHLLARMAGNIAAGMMPANGQSVSVEECARSAVAIARAILAEIEKEPPP